MIGTTMWYEQFDWPESEPDPKDLKECGVTFKLLVYQMTLRVIETLDQWLDAPLSEAEKYTCAVMLYNNLEAPPLAAQGASFGKKGVRDTRAALSTARKLLKKARKQDLTSEEAAFDYRNKAVKSLVGLPTPACIQIAIALGEGPEVFEEHIGHMCDLYDGYVDNMAGETGKYVSKRVALRLRAIFEVYSQHPVTAGNEGSVPIGHFARCLDAIFKMIGMTDVHFYPKARYACSISAEDTELCGYREALTKGPALIEQYIN